MANEVSIDQAKLWHLIVSYGLQHECERDWRGRVKFKRTGLYIRTDITPELAQLLADTSVRLAGAAGAATAALNAGQSRLRQLLTQMQEPTTSDD